MHTPGSVMDGEIFRRWLRHFIIQLVLLIQRQLLAFTASALLTFREPTFATTSPVSAGLLFKRTPF